MRRVFTPLPEVSDCSDRIAVQVDSLALPVGLDPSKIGLDIATTERAARLCDTSFLGIIGANIDEERVEVDGNIQADGSLVGAQVRTQQATNDLSVGFNFNKEAAKSVVSVIALNNGLRKSSVRDTADLYDPVFQSRMLDKQLRKGLKGVARDNQLELGHSRFSNALWAIGDISLAAWVATSISSGHVDALGMLMFPGLRASMAGLNVTTAHAYGLESKPSALWYRQLDRYAIACGYLATHKLIAPLAT